MRPLRNHFYLSLNCALRCSAACMRGHAYSIWRTLVVQHQTSYNGNVFVPQSTTPRRTTLSVQLVCLLCGCLFGGVELADRLHEREACRTGHVQTKSKDVFVCTVAFLCMQLITCCFCRPTLSYIGRHFAMWWRVCLSQKVAVCLSRWCIVSKRLSRSSCDLRQTVAQPF